MLTLDSDYSAEAAGVLIQRIFESHHCASRLHIIVPYFWVNASLELTFRFQQFLVHGGITGLISAIDHEGMDDPSGKFSRLTFELRCHVAGAARQRALNTKQTNGEGDFSKPVPGPLVLHMINLQLDQIYDGTIFCTRL